jgi:NADH:ubiquinone oxidoreductase subunit 4 (subunit M)
VIFLGQPRDAALQHVHEAGWRKRIGMIWLAAGCLFLGLFPTLVLAWLEPVVHLLLGEALPPGKHGLFLTPCLPNAPAMPRWYF